MKKFLRILFLFSFVSMLFITSCKDDDPLVQTETEFELLTTHMAQNNLELSDVLSGWVTSGSGLDVDPTDFSVSGYYIIDIRGADDFNTGHIKDAHNVPLVNVLTEAEKAGTTPILVVCYTGQTAARAVGALRLMGFEAKSLKWGMSAWHSDLAGKWVANATDYASPNWVKTGTPPALQTFDDPVLYTSKTDGESILQARVLSALSNSSWGISKVDVLQSPGNYFIVNKWPIESWDAYGHISGANRIDEDLRIENLNYLDPSKDLVVYCYTGQTSAITGMWMDVAGYNVKSLLFGVNGINHSELQVGTAGSAAKKSWHGTGSGSELNFGYYDADGNLYMPKL